MSSTRRMRLPVLAWAPMLLCSGCGQTGPLYFSEQPVAEIEIVEPVEAVETAEIEQPEASQSE